MRFIILAILLFSSACATKSRLPASALPVVFKEQELVELEQALKYGPVSTLPYLKANLKVKSFDGLNAKNLNQVLPQSLKAEKAVVVNSDKNIQHRYISKFRPWSFVRKSRRAHLLIEDFDCSKALETQALAYSLELDFPNKEAIEQSQHLHEKVLVCQTFSRQESLFRLAIFAIQKMECSRALSYLEQFPSTPERGVNDRLAYLQGLCSAKTTVKTRNPLGGYGILLKGEAESSAEVSSWKLSTTSGDESWDRLLATLVELHEKGQSELIQALASKLNYEKFRTLPFEFQTSLLVLLNFSGADLPVFQTLHKYLSDHPEKISSSVTGLLFPIRYWEKIVEHSKTTDPVLVKSLIRQESAFNPHARSRAKAAGLMQLIYPTAKHFGIRKANELLDPEANIQAGSEFLSRLIGEFGSVELALAAYNAGPGIVRQWQKRYPTESMDLFVEMIPYAETREYVRLVKRNYQIYQSLLIKPQVLGNLDLSQ